MAVFLFLHQTRPYRWSDPSIRPVFYIREQGLLIGGPEQRHLRCGHVEVHHTVFGIEFACDLVSFLRIVVRDHLHNHLLQILVAAAERGGLLRTRLGETGGPCLVTLADLDGKNVLGRIKTVLHVLWIVQILQHTLAEGDAVLIDVDIRIGISY